MINLIPPEAQSHIVTEYWFRVAAVWLMMLAVTMGLVAILLLPAYVLVTNQVSVNTQAAEAIMAESGEQSSALKLLTQANLYADAVVVSAGRQSLLSVFDAIASVTTPDVISISNYSFARTDAALGQIKIDGEALTRRDLISFRDKLTEHPLIDKVNLPIANLAKDKNIPFSITLTIATSTPAS